MALRLLKMLALLMEPSTRVFTWSHTTCAQKIIIKYFTRHPSNNFITNPAHPFVMNSSLFVWRVRIIAFASGAAVMGVELMASRLIGKTKFILDRTIRPYYKGGFIICTPAQPGKTASGAEKCRNMKSNLLSVIEDSSPRLYRGGDGLAIQFKVNWNYNCLRNLRWPVRHVFMIFGRLDGEP